MKPIQVAEICSEANRVYCIVLGDTPQPVWADAPKWHKESLFQGVLFHMRTPGAGPENSHKEWLKVKEADGWKYGKVKDVDKKEHPCMVPYYDLPNEQKVKDSLFLGIVNALRNQVVMQVAVGEEA